MYNGLSDEYCPEHMRLLERRNVLTSPFINVYEDTVELPSVGARMDRYWVEHRDAVAVLAVRGSGDGAAEEVLLIRQYRIPVRSFLWEIPAGILDIEGEYPMDAARRELREETDYTAGELEFLTRFYTSPGFTNEQLTVYLTRNPAPVAAAFAREDEEAEIEVRWVPLPLVREAIMAGRVANPQLVAAVLAYLARRS